MKKASKLSTFIALLFSLGMTFAAFSFIENSYFAHSLLLLPINFLCALIGIFGLVLSFVLVNILIKKYK
tara:strand:- start:85801 stop:86007 length:207 start_codon:yes stop_codon:yes gene_type:complete